MTPQAFADEVRAGDTPMVMRGVVRDWPAVRAAATPEGARDYLSRFETHRPVATMYGAPAIEGRFFYNENLSGVNFEKGGATIAASLDELVRGAADPSARTVYVQSIPIPQALPDFAEENPLGLEPKGTEPRIWIGGPLTVQTHYDLSSNIACCVAGKRRFLLFPPDQLPNLYPGPFEMTLAGPPVSMVQTGDVDLERYPRFAEAMRHAMVAELEPGDAIYVPFAWWHQVVSTGRFNILVNYWWNEAASLGSPYDALLHAVLAIRDLPNEQRRVWAGMFAHYAFEENGHSTAHLPPHARGPLGELDDRARDRTWATLATSVMREAVRRNGPPPGLAGGQRSSPGPRHQTAALPSWHMGTSTRSGPGHN